MVGSVNPSSYTSPISSVTAQRSPARRRPARWRGPSRRRCRWPHSAAARLSTYEPHKTSPWPTADAPPRSKTAPGRKPPSSFNIMVNAIDPVPSRGGLPCPSRSRTRGRPSHPFRILDTSARCVSAARTYSELAGKICQTADSSASRPQWGAEQQRGTKRPRKKVDVFGTMNLAASRHPWSTARSAQSPRACG
jgi:hypothetical protein